MTCAACAVRIEKGLKKKDGVVEANVNFALEKSKIIFDPSKANVNQFRDFRDKVQFLGYKVMSEKVEFDISGMTCAVCANKIEKRLNKLKHKTATQRVSHPRNNRTNAMILTINENQMFCFIIVKVFLLKFNICGSF